MYIFNNYFQSLYKRSKSGFHRLTLLTIVLICSCAHIFSSSSHNTGGIYGKVTLNSRKKPLGNVKVRVEGTGLSTKVDSSGIFYIPEVPPGTYTLIASAPKFLDEILENVFIAKDSISISFMRLNEAKGSTISEKEIWKGIKTGKVDVKSKGKIKGHIRENSFLDNAMVCIENTFWVTYTDSLGEYQLTDILPGKYTLKAFGGGPRIEWEDAGPGPKEGMRTLKPKNFNWDKIMGASYRPKTIENVRVAPDSTSIVNIRLQSTWIPEDYPLIERKEIIIKNSE